MTLISDKDLQSPLATIPVIQVHVEVCRVGRDRIILVGDPVDIDAHDCARMGCGNAKTHVVGRAVLLRADGDGDWDREAEMLRLMIRKQPLCHGVLWFNYSTEDRTVMWSWELARFRTDAEAKAFQAGVDLSDNHIGFMWPQQRDDVIEWLDGEFVDSDGRPVKIADVEAAIQGHSAG